MARKKTYLVLSYNDVKNFPAGVYEAKGKRVIIHSQDRRYYEDSPEKLSELLHNMYGKVKMDKVDNVVVYAGLNAMKGALYAARSLAHDGKNVSLVACSCDSGVKRYFADRNNLDITWSECGGRRTLESMVNNILGK